MNFYETTYIVNSALELEEIKGVKTEIDDWITSDGGEIYSRSDWGRTRLAYEIDKQRYGNFIILKYAAKPTLIKQLKEKFGLMDAILSHLSITLDEEPERISEEIIVQKDEPAKFDKPEHSERIEKSKTADKVDPEVEVKDETEEKEESEVKEETKDKEETEEAEVKEEAKDKEETEEAEVKEETEDKEETEEAEVKEETEDKEETEEAEVKEETEEKEETA